MLESTSDYIALISIVAVFLLIGYMVVYLINLKVIEKNVRIEIKYYHYDKDKQITSGQDGKQKRIG